jgi:hypothetical protein
MKFREKPGDDTGMQTRVWGPAGWLFLHSIAQNYPWKPTEQQKVEYLFFFKLVGNVLPCRYCRESYQVFIEEEDTQLNIHVMESRKTLAEWLYLIHNKVNSKLNVTSNPTFKEVWDKYESYRSKCTKTLKVDKKTGCIDPMKGYRKRCFLAVEDVDESGNRFGFGKSTGNTGSTGSTGNTKSTKQKLKLVSVRKSTNAGKKLMATFLVNGKRKRVIHFGAAGMSDYRKHKDPNRKKRYITRHRKDLGTKNPARAGFLSMFILWNKKSLGASVADYRRRLNIYNRTGKFPTG